MWFFIFFVNMSKIMLNKILSLGWDINDCVDNYDIQWVVSKMKLKIKLSEILKIREIAEFEHAQRNLKIDNLYSYLQNNYWDDEFIKKFENRTLLKDEFELLCTEYNINQEYLNNGKLINHSEKKYKQQFVQPVFNGNQMYYGLV